MTTPTHSIVYRPIAEIHELEGNPRVIKKDQFEKLKTSIKNNPDYFEARPCILSNRTGVLVVIAGNQRLRASRELGMTEVPTILLEGLTEEREREIIVRDNVENGEWDYDMLANQWEAEDLNDWGVETPWKGEDEMPTDLDADTKDEGIFLKISFKSEAEANRFLDEMRDQINTYDCTMTTHGGAL